MSFVHLFRRYLRDQGLPVTQQREEIAEVVFSSSEHLSVEEIEARLRAKGERIGKATIYRTLEMLVRSGLVEEYDFGEGFKRYKHLFGQTLVREHLICTECGKVEEVETRELVQLQEELARAHGFQPARHRLEMYGICAACQATGRVLEWQGLTCPIEAL
jgi:Fur family transcriptional regulator, ferric uptake regulator